MSSRKKDQAIYRPGRGGGSSRGGSNTSSSHEGRGGSRGGSRGGGSGGSSRSSSRGGSSRRGGRGGRSSRGDRNATPYSRPSRNSAFGGSKDTGRGGRGGSSRGRGGGRGGRGGGSGDRGPSTILCISGYGSDVKFEDVQKFLTSALGRQFRYIKLHVGKTADVTVNDSDVDKVLGLSGGAIKGNQVQITVKSKSSKSGSGGGKSTYDKKLSHQNKETLKQYIGMKYNNTNHVLDLRDCTTSLSSIRADFQNTAFVNDIGNIIKNNCPEVRTINFADNDISSLAGFRYFHKSAPNLANLCFSNNPIMSLEELDHLKGYEKKLNELILKGIPAVHGLDSRIYNHEILSRFPTLKLLDLNPVQKLIEFNLPTHVSSVSLPPAKGSFFDTPGSQSTTTDFVQKFFAMYDSNRQKLFTVYNENACFSLSIPANVRYGILPKEYVTHSRNLNTLSSSSTSSSSSSFHSSYKSSAANKQKMADAMVYTLLKQGPAYIVVALDQLPATKHDINSFIADVFVLPSKSGQQLLQLSIHGSFLEVGANVTRKFHRVMLLTPSTNPQWPVCILNDQLFISSQFTKQQQQPVNDQSINVNLSLQSNSNNQVQQQQGSVQQQQEAMARQLSMQGMVSIDVAGQLLMQNNWNFGMATNQLQQLKSMGKL